MDVRIKRFDDADKSVELVKGLLEVIEIGGMVLGRAEYEPGWLWSRDVAGDATGTTLCQASHLGIVLEGENKVTMTDGTVYMLRPGDVFEIGPGHESEVVGDARYVSIHLSGIEQYIEKT
ncbi:MAG: cupin [Actinomycetota bacterium]